MTENSEGGRLVSPNDMLDAAKVQMLGGREVATHEDKILVLNFVACNTANGMEVPVAKLFARIYGWDDVSDELAEEIATFQADAKLR